MSSKTIKPLVLLLGTLFIFTLILLLPACVGLDLEGRGSMSEDGGRPSSQLEVNSLSKGIFSLEGSTFIEPDGERIALVIGNSSYLHMNQLTNPENDATDMAELLGKLGFEVDLLLDGSLSEIESSIRTYLDKSKDREVKTTLFFYAGHAVQYEGANYLIPIDSDIKREHELIGKAYNMEVLLKGLEGSSADLNLIILDACRDNPFSTSRGGARGLSAMGFGSSESMVVFATSPGSVATDGVGRNSPFTQAMKEHLPTPDLEVRQLIAQVSKSVQEETGGRQVPWITTSFTGQFYFLTSSEELALREGQLANLSHELAQLEAELATRLKEMESVHSLEERGELELEQQRLKALAESKRLEEERILALQKGAEERLKVQQQELMAREQLQSQLTAEGRVLEELARQRRLELESLAKQQSQAQSIWDRLDTIAQYEKTIVDVRKSYDETIRLTNIEFESLKQQLLASYKRVDPQDPWETNREFEARVQKYAVQLDGENQNQITLIEGQKNREINQLTAQLNHYKSESSAEEYRIGFGHTEVRVLPFDAEGKYFPIEIIINEGPVSQKISLHYKITATEREEISKQYARVNDADKANALVAALVCTMREYSPQNWTIAVKQIDVYTLLEGGSTNPKQLFTKSFSGSEQGVALDVEIMNGEVIRVVSKKEYRIGELGPAGGYIFYDKGDYSDGWRYLEAAPAGWSGKNVDPVYEFGGYGKNINTYSVIGTGKDNTASLVRTIGGGNYAAKVAWEYSRVVNGVRYDDWFLPSKGELNQMYLNLGKKGLSGFFNDYYWSSTGSSSPKAWVQNFLNGYQGNFSRIITYRVRPIRAF